MSADRETLLSESLRARADAGRPIEAGLLLSAALVRGRRRRTRRQILGATLAAAAVVTVGAAAATVLPRRPTAVPAVSSVPPSPAPYVRPQPVNQNLALMPDAGQPGAITRPDLVGTDPGVVHFSVDALAGAAFETTLSSGPGVESAVVAALPEFRLAVTLARDEADLPPETASFGRPDPGGETPPGVDAGVGGRPAVVRAFPGLFWITWQPVDGLWARATVQAGTQDEAVAHVLRVRFDRSRLVRLPFRVTGLPAGMAVRERAVTLRSDSDVVPFMYGTIGVGDGRRRLLFEGHGTTTADDRPHTHTAGPYRVSAQSDGDRWSVDMTHRNVRILANTESDGVSGTQAEALEVIAGLEFADRLDDTSGWF
ncbi:MULTISPECIES: hypothetical protein [Catenuloplanes]|uniref:Uncharacterized protein n=1 Tax=Catenuloplanes niger TaxID=587534 RepID=A0AAE4CW63_9ACTN|nr:hypothetical protein [Catenuloplanes niger]MDR7326172.1 hypothetical protein [Catenuloplanes niger]